MFGDEVFKLKVSSKLLGLAVYQNFQKFSIKPGSLSMWPNKRYFVSVCINERGLSKTSKVVSFNGNFGTSVGIAVGRHSGHQFATTLVDCYFFPPQSNT